MKQHLSITIITTGLVALLAGCKPKPVASAEQEMAVPQFSATRGLSLPEETRRSLGLKLVEVTERKVGATLSLQLRVYRADGAVVLASATVTPEQAKFLQAGQQLDVRTSDGRAMAGRVSAVSDQLQKTAGFAEALVEIPTAPKSLAVGDFLQATATVNSGETVATIPHAALLGCSEGHFVYTVSGEHLVRTAVKVGACNDELVEIKDGLYAGDQVALYPVMSLWMAELAATKGGQACCVKPPKGK